MDMTDKTNNYIEDIEFVHDVVSAGGCLEMHSLGFWLKDYVGNIIGNLSDPVCSKYREIYGSQRVVNYKGERILSDEKLTLF
ncbi:hypothetical protein [Breznakia pachnodae]|uniref:Uncharacterized protein n=1 Tax=Breznakia pachnodae TaxID=265178 RepID=A0ABU0E6I4_9FIRM|nr:hypothetical protein [Breznakia pachnodae]MDQ0362514.1 hypothetical protein [Breznakia pachnodae]